MSSAACKTPITDFWHTEWGGSTIRFGGHVPRLYQCKEDFAVSKQLRVRFQLCARRED